VRVAHRELAGEITFTSADGPSVLAHPLCPDTWRNGKPIGDEPPVQGYRAPRERPRRFAPWNGRGRSTRPRSLAFRGGTFRNAQRLPLP